VEPKRLPREDAPRPSQVFEAQLHEAIAAGRRLGDDMLAAVAYLERNGPRAELAPRLMACMLSASSVMGHLLKSAITMATNGPERVEVGGPPPRPR
jgi:hypothetical protein